MSEVQPPKSTPTTEPKLFLINLSPRFSSPLGMDIVPVNCPITVTLDLSASDPSLTHRVSIADTSGWTFDWGDYSPGVTTRNFTIDPMYGDQVLIMTVNIPDDVNPVPSQSANVIRVLAAPVFYPEATSEYGPGPVHILEDDSVTFYVTLIGGIPPYDYEVRINGAKVDSGAGVPAGSYSYTHKFETADVYTASFKAVDKLGCQPSTPLEDIVVNVYEDV